MFLCTIIKKKTGKLIILFCFLNQWQQLSYQLIYCWVERCFFLLMYMLGKIALRSCATTGLANSPSWPGQLTIILKYYSEILLHFSNQYFFVCCCFFICVKIEFQEPFSGSILKLTMTPIIKIEFRNVLLIPIQWLNDCGLLQTYCCVFQLPTTFIYIVSSDNNFCPALHYFVTFKILQY